MSFEILREVRHASRRLTTERSSSLVVILCLALGIGANATVFAVADAVLLQPLPYPESQDLMSVFRVARGPDGSPANIWTAAPIYLEIDRAQSFSSVGGALQREFNLTGELEAERVRGAEITHDLFTTLGVEPILGRVFTVDEDRAGAEPVVMISEALWQRRYGGDPSIVGTSVRVDEIPHTVVGVIRDVPAMVWQGDLWRPLAVQDLGGTWLVRNAIQTVTRLAPGVTIEQAREELRALAEFTRDRYPGIGSRGDWLDLQNLHENVRGDLTPVFLALFGGVGFLLTIACANIANLLLVKVERAHRELAIRSALGAARGRLAVGLITESLLLASVGSALGVAAAYVALRSLVGLMPVNLPGLDQVGVNWSVLLVGLGAGVTTVLIAGAAPLAALSPTSNLLGVFRGGSKTAGTGRSGRRLKEFFVVAEVALGIVLLVAGGATVRNLRALNERDYGFEPEGLLTTRLGATDTRYPEFTSRVSLYQEIERRVSALPGVTAAGATHVFPIGDIAWAWSFGIEDDPPEDHNERTYAFGRLVTPGFHAALGIPLLEGRYFDELDVLGSPWVAVVSQGLAEEYWPNESVIGKRLKRRGYYSDRPWLTVVGVVGDVLDEGTGVETGQALYLPHAQNDEQYGTSLTLVVRTKGDPGEALASVREAISQVAPESPLFRIQTGEEIVAGSLQQSRFTAVLLATFATLGMLLAGTGIYGVMSYLVGERRREIAVRLAIGAERSTILLAVVGRAGILSLLGLVMGLAGSIALVRPLGALVAETQVLDPTVLLIVLPAMGVVALVSASLPAIRAARVDPALTLRG